MIYLGLGSNQGERRKNLRDAIAKLKENGFEIVRISPVIETAAMLGAHADPDWLQPYLNCVIECRSDCRPRQGLDIVKRIESELGRKAGPRWSPRPIDIDLLIWNDQYIREPDLCIPHVGIAERSFVLTPLLHLVPELRVPGIGASVFELNRAMYVEPLWMGIINVTPDSFSGDGLHGDPGKLESAIDHCVLSGVQILDIGAESTRPDAKPADPDEEWARLQPALSLLAEKTRGDLLRPRISLDSRHWQTVSKALDASIDCINDVGGLGDKEMCAIVKDSGCEAIAMHSLSVPADPKQTLGRDQSAVAQIKAWLERRMEYWSSLGLDPAKIIIDPGIGFGKDALQSLELLRACQQLRDEGLRLLIGHSRKSFMKTFSRGMHDRDLETLGISLALSGNVDIFRVHDPVSHQRAHLACRHVR